MSAAPRVAIIGGGLAGLAASVALCERGWRVELFEARRQFGGRAGSFRDRESGELVDHCQHVSMGCCTNFEDLCQRTEMQHLFRRERLLTFIGPSGKETPMRAARWLPAPLHLAPSLLRINYLSLTERLSIARTLWRLARTLPEQVPSDCDMARWLQQQGASRRTMDYFWSVALVSAVAESVDQISFAIGRKVFVDGFMGAPCGYELRVPTASLREIYSHHLAQWLVSHSAKCNLDKTINRLMVGKSKVDGIEIGDGSQRSFDYYILALSWRRFAQIVHADCRQLSSQRAAANQIQSSPITGVHLWFDRPITRLPHAVIVGRLSQWLFNRGQRPTLGNGCVSGYYYQVVISASRELAARDRAQVVAEIRDDLASIWPVVNEAKLIQWRMITEQEAVFSTKPGSEALRVSQQTSLGNLALAGDWTQTGWPATMEGAVRSGYLAAEVILTAAGQPDRILVDDLRYGWLSKWIVKRSRDSTT